VKTFVVGLGVNAASVNAIAQAGGTGQLISANNQAELTAALDSIALAISSCDFALGSTPPDPTKLNVYFNGEPSGVPEDPTNGWSYDPATNTIRFHGSSCDQIESQQVSSIVVGLSRRDPYLTPVRRGDARGAPVARCARRKALGRGWSARRHATATVAVPRS
jgi:hypothetical protein